MTKTGLQLLPPSQPGYIGSPDTTFAGSRNGCSAVVLWTYISTHSYEKSVEKLTHCQELAEWFTNQMIALAAEIGKDLWVSRSKLSLAIRFKKPRDDIVFKYTLANETISLEGDPAPTRTYTHVYVMGFTTKEKLQELLADLRTDGAFPDQPAARKLPEIAGLMKESEDLHRGILVGPKDASLIGGTRKLLYWPSNSSRGFK